MAHLTVYLLLSVQWASSQHKFVSKRAVASACLQLVEDLMDLDCDLSNHSCTFVVFAPLPPFGSLLSHIVSLDWHRHVYNRVCHDFLCAGVVN
uniref:Secreted protein n=1 Tax=Rhipicephalus appendiculatus TaxID=34631 RepID=A0A131YE65_RHIAP